MPGTLREPRWAGNPWLAIGSWLMILAAGGHVILVDLALHLEAIDWIEETGPVPILEAMRESHLDWGIFGGNTPFRLYAGKSLWMAFSVGLFGVYNLLILRSTRPGDRLRRHVLCLALVVTSVFTLLSAIFLIAVPIICGAAVTGIFGKALHNERAARRRR